MTLSHEEGDGAAKPVRRRSRRSLALDARRRNEICAVIAMGCTRSRAAAFVGCDARTIVNTARREPEFAVNLRKAEAQREVTLLAKIQEAAKGKGGWKAACWLLERMYPDRYATRRAGTMTREQVGTVLAQFTEILTRKIRNAEDRRNVGAELRLLTHALTSEGAGEPSR